MTPTTKLIKYDVVVTMTEEELLLIISALTSLIPQSSRHEEVILRLHYDYNYALNQIRQNK